MKRQKQDSVFSFWLAASALLHFIAMLVLWLGLPQIRKPLPEPMRIIPVEIAELAPITAAPKQKDEPPPPKPPEPEPPKPEPPKPEPKPPEPAPKPPEQKPEPPKPEEKPEPKPESKPEPKKKEESKKKKEEPKPPDRLASVLKNVAKLKNAPALTEEKSDKKATPAPTPPQAPAIADRLLVNEEDALRQQIRNCWNVPIGARDIEKTVVEIYIEVGPDRVLRRAEVVDKGRMARDPFFRAVAESAIRALYNPLCSPLALPPEKYQQWKEIIFNFNPRDMF